MIIGIAASRVLGLVLGTILLWTVGIALCWNIWTAVKRGRFDPARHWHISIRHNPAQFLVFIVAYSCFASMVTVAWYVLARDLAFR